MITTLKKELLKLKKEFFQIKKMRLYKMFVWLCIIAYPLFVEKYVYPDEPLSFFRFVVSICTSLIIGLYLMFGFKKVNDYIYRKRYAIGFIIFAFLVSFQFHGSSVGIYNNIIEPDTQITESYPYIGTFKNIRSDEWGSSTLNLLSMATPQNDFSTINHTIMGGVNKNTILYPSFPCRTFIGYINIKNWGFFLLPIENAFSYYWYIEYFILFFAAFELFMIITKKKRMFSLLGAILILASPVVQWWNFTNIMAYGFLAVDLFYLFIQSKKIWKKIILAFLIGICGCYYIMTMYPAWMVPIAYFLLGLCIWIMIENKKNWKIMDIVMLVGIVAITIAAIILPAYLISKEVVSITANTVYPGKRLSLGGYGWEKLFNYFVSISLPYNAIFNKPEASQFLSLYPLPLILGICYFIYNKACNKKNDWFLLITSVIVILLSLWNYVELPLVVSKISMLSMSTAERCTVIVGMICVFMMIYILAMYTNDRVSVYRIIMSLLAAITATYIVYSIQKNISTDIMNKEMIITIVSLTLTIFFILINTTNAKNIVFVLLTFISIYSTFGIQPLSRTLDVVYEKPISKKIQEISLKDPKARWISEYHIASNYVLANGASVLNSTNYFPNYDLWNIIDEKGEYEDIWNRFAYLSINIISEETNIQLPGNDQVALNLNSNDLCKLNIKYLMTPSPNRNELSTKNMKIDKIYEKENLFIYQIECKGYK